MITRCDVNKAEEKASSGCQLNLRKALPLSVLAIQVVVGTLLRRTGCLKINPELKTTYHSNLQAMLDMNQWFRLA